MQKVITVAETALDLEHFLYDKIHEKEIIKI